MITVEKLRRIQSELADEYGSTAHKCPWIVGFSGGKDSTLVVHLVFETLLALPPSERNRKIVVLANDTLVESPVLMQQLQASI